jgi:hypothetical protein
MEWLNLESTGDKKRKKNSSVDSFGNKSPNFGQILTQ